MTLEMGKLAKPAREEVLKAARGCRYYAEHGAAFLAEEDIPTEATRSYIRYEPMGPIFAIMPWNFPFWQVFRFAAPALMAGNVALLKHAPNVPQCALAIEEVFTRAGFPEGVFQTLLIEVEQVPAILDDPRVKAVTLTGSDRAGRDVASRAGRALKKSVLELGGSDPFIVTPTADLTQAVATAVKSRLFNSGQSCIAAKRFIVIDAVADEFLRRFTEAMGAVKVGDPLDPSTELGPLARADLVQSLTAQVNDAVAHGARAADRRRADRSSGLLLSGDGARRHARVGARVPRRAVRPGRDGVSREGSRRGDRARQRHAVRPRRDGLHERRGRTRSAGRGAGGGTGLRQRDGRVRSARAVRRRQAVGLRTRAGAAGHPRVHEHQDGVGGHPRASEVETGLASRPARGDARYCDFPRAVIGQITSTLSLRMP